MLTWFKISPTRNLPVTEKDIPFPSSPIVPLCCVTSPFVYQVISQVLINSILRPNINELILSIIYLEQIFDFKKLWRMPNFHLTKHQLKWPGYGKNKLLWLVKIIYNSLRALVSQMRITNQKKRRPPPQKKPSKNTTHTKKWNKQYTKRLTSQFAEL